MCSQSGFLCHRCSVSRNSLSSTGLLARPNGFKGVVASPALYFLGFKATFMYKVQSTDGLLSYSNVMNNTDILLPTPFLSNSGCQCLSGSRVSSAISEIATRDGSGMYPAASGCLPDTLGLEGSSEQAWHSSSSSPNLSPKRSMVNSICIPPSEVCMIGFVSSQRAILVSRVKVLHHVLLHACKRMRVYVHRPEAHASGWLKDDC